MTTHLVVPSVSAVDRARGGLSFYRGLAVACAAREATVVHEVATAADAPWDGVPLHRHPDAAGLAAAVGPALAEGDTLVKVVGSLGVDEAAIDCALLAAAEARGAAVAWFDPDAPARLVHLVDRPSFRATAGRVGAVLLAAGGGRAAAEYLAAGVRVVAHVTPALAALPYEGHLATAPDDTARDLDVVVPVAASSTRDDRVYAVLAEWLDRGVARRLVLVGHADGVAARLDDPAVKCVPLVDAAGLQGLYRRSRFTLNLARDEFAGYGVTVAARVTEAMAAGCVVVTDAVPGIDAVARPGDECVLLDRARHRLPDGAGWRRMARRASARLAHDLATARHQVAAALDAVAPAPPAGVRRQEVVPCS